MANTKSAKKMVRKIATRTDRNRMRRSRVRNFERRVEEAITSGDHSAARQALQQAEPEIMRGAQRGVFHKRRASRRISRLTKRVIALQA
jgi:small subunit ribosomal protein S20